MKRFFEKLGIKLHARGGEILVETLAAILIIALSTAMLATAVMTATKINLRANNAASQLYASGTAAAEQDYDHSGDVSVVISGTVGADATVDFPVSYTGSGSMTAYFLPGGG